MEYIVNSNESPLIFEYDDNKRIIIFLDGEIIKEYSQESRIKCICNVICNCVIKIIRFFLHKK